MDPGPRRSPPTSSSRPLDLERRGPGRRRSSTGRRCARRGRPHPGRVPRARRYADRRAAGGRERAHPGPRVRRRCVVGPRRHGLVRRVDRPAPPTHRARWRAGRDHPGVARGWLGALGRTATCTRSTDGWPSCARRTRSGRRGAVDVVNEIVVLDTEGGQDVVVSGPDFVSDPRWSPDGDSLAWLEWDHPAMPWDSSTLKVQNAMGVVTVAGGVDEGGEGICQPRWAPDGSLWFCSDRDDWWSLYRWTPEAGVERCSASRARSGTPQVGLRRLPLRVPRGRPRRARGAARGDRLAAPARASTAAPLVSRSA